MALSAVDASAVWRVMIHLFGTGCALGRVGIVCDLLLAPGRRGVPSPSVGKEWEGPQSLAISGASRQLLGELATDVT